MILKRAHRTTREPHSQKNSNNYVIKISYLVVLGTLLIGNILMFASSVKISDQITHVETKIEDIRKENSELQQKILAENSLQTLEYIAEHTGYTKQAEPYYLGETGYAMAQ